MFREAAAGQGLAAGPLHSRPHPAHRLPIHPPCAGEQLYELLRPQFMRPGSVPGAALRRGSPRGVAAAWWLLIAAIVTAETARGTPARWVRAGTCPRLVRVGACGVRHARQNRRPGHVRAARSCVSVSCAGGSVGGACRRWRSHPAEHAPAGQAPIRGVLALLPAAAARSRVQQRWLWWPRRMLPMPGPASLASPWW